MMQNEIKNLSIEKNYRNNDARGFEKSELHEEDTTFFVQGKFFEDSRGDEYMIQAITHA